MGWKANFGGTVLALVQVTGVTIHRILVPIDFGESSDGAVDLAIEFARAFDARVTLAHVYQLSVYANAAPFMPYIDTAQALEGACKEAMAKCLASVRSRYPKADAILRAGYASDEIVLMIAMEKADLVLMGTHGRHGLSLAVLGSVAERVVRTSSVPVLTVRGAAYSR